MEKEIICINCPLGCRVEVNTEIEGAPEVSGYGCLRGKEFALQETVEPLRNITSLMRVHGSERPVSVKTSGPVPKRLYFACIGEIFKTEAKLPLHAGDVLLPDILGTGVDILCTQNREKE